MKEFIYMDNAATTPVDPQVLEAMLPYFTEKYGNASSIYTLGRNASADLENAREQIANAFGAQKEEIFFTSGGSESINWALKGGAQHMQKKGKNHIISTNIEHHAALHSLETLEKQGFKVTLVEVEPNGIVDVEKIVNAITPETGLISVMYANNEIGTIQPIEEIGEICKERGILFHTDAVQAVGKVEINLKDSGITMMSASGHKLHGPKGVGFIYIKRGIRLPNLIDGGGQEKGRRGGTENLPGIIGLAKAVEISTKDIKQRNEKMTAIRNRLIEGILQIPQSQLNGDKEKRLSNNVNISFNAIEGESLLLFLDHNGIQASSGSACTSGSLDPSHVLMAIGLPHEIAHGSLRVSLSDENTMEEAEKLIEVLPSIVERLREMSPLWVD